MRFNYTQEQLEKFPDAQSFFKQQEQIEFYKKKQKKELIRTGIMLGATMMAFLLVQAIDIEILKIFNLRQLYNESSFFQSCYSIIGVHIFALLPFPIMALMLKRNFISPFFPAEKIKPSTGFCWVGFGMLCCICTNYLTSFIMIIVKNFTNYELTQSDIAKPNDWLSCIALIVSTAIAPAICEEIALRCCALGVLKKFGKGFAVFVISFMFGLLHGNVIQLIFAMIVGIILGYITIKTDNVIIAMIVHGCNNGISVVKDIAIFAANEKVGIAISSIVFIAWLIVGAVCTLLLLVKGELKNKPKQYNPADNSFGVKLLCLLPGFALPILYFSAYIASSVVSK